MAAAYDALLLVSFGGPEGPDEVLPFLDNVLRGRNVPRERMLEVAQHYAHFGGVSPINEQNRQLIAALERELATHGPQFPIYWGNRNWRPFLADALRQMAADGVQRALAFVTSAYSSYSSCRQYREDITRAQQEVGPTAPQVDKLRIFFNHPGFIEPMVESVAYCLNQIPPAERDRLTTLFTAHSIPISMADNCRYMTQLQEASRLVAEAAGLAHWELVYQSRSGPPQTASRRRRPRPSPRPHRFHLRSPRSALRHRHRSPRTMQRVRHPNAARGHGRRPSALRPHDPRTNRRAHDQRRRPPRPRQPRPQPQRMPSGLLPLPAATARRHIIHVSVHPQRLEIEP